MKALAYLGALSSAIFTFEVLESWIFAGPSRDRLQGISAGAPKAVQAGRSSWSAILLILFPALLIPERSKSGRDIVDLLRRSGYLYATPGEFSAQAIRTFSIFLALGGLAAGLMIAVDGSLLAAIGSACVFVFLGLRRPYNMLRLHIRRRAAALRNNMLTGLSVLQALLASGVSVQESLRRSAAVGGPFCNLLGLLVTQMEITSFEKAVDTTEAHLPHAEDVEAILFLRAVRDFFIRNRPLFPSVKGLQAAVHREVLEATEARAALVRQRSGLFGVMAVVGLVISIIAPFLNVLS